MRKLSLFLFVILASLSLSSYAWMHPNCHWVGGRVHWVNGNKVWVPAHNVCRGANRYGQPGIWVPGHYNYNNGHRYWVPKHWQSH